MNVLLNGATHGTNFGDFLFAKAFEDYVGAIVGEENVFWYNSRYTMSKFYADRLNNNITSLKHIDALVYISGGYFCGNDKCIKDYIIRYLTYFHVGMQCILRKIPYAIIGLEVGEPKSKLMKLIQKLILKKSDVVVVRNKESLEYLKEYGIDNGICTADTVFALKADLYGDYLPNNKILNCEKKKIFLHVDSRESFNKMLVDKIFPVINLFLKQHPEYAVVIGVDQYVDNQHQILQDLADKINAENVMLNIYDNPLELVNVIKECDVVVTHKLHVGIVGAKLSKSVISFSVHTEKVKRLYKQLGVPERSIALDQLTTDKGVEMMNKFHMEPINVSDEITQNAEKNFDILKSFIEKISKNSM